MQKCLSRQSLNMCLYEYDLNFTLNAFKLSLWMRKLNCLLFSFVRVFLISHWSCDVSRGCWKLCCVLNNIQLILFISIEYNHTILFTFLCKRDKTISITPTRNICKQFTKQSYHIYLVFARTTRRNTLISPQLSRYHLYRTGGNATSNCKLASFKFWLFLLIWLLK